MTHREALLARLAIDLDEMVHRAHKLGLDAVAGELRLARTDVEQAARLVGDLVGDSGSPPS